LSSSPNPKGNARPKILDPRPSTLHPPPSTLHPQPSTLNQVLSDVGAGAVFEGAIPTLKLHPGSSALLASLASYLPKIPAIVLAMVIMDKLGRRALLLCVIPLLALSLAGLALSTSLPETFPLRPHAAVLALSLYGESPPPSPFPLSLCEKAQDPQDPPTRNLPLSSPSPSPSPSIVNSHSPICYLKDHFPVPKP
jgi:hypothetical protein